MGGNCNSTNATTAKTRQANTGCQMRWKPRTQVKANATVQKTICGTATIKS